MSRIVRDIERPDPALCAALAELGVATVHEASGRRGLMEPAIRPLAQGQRAGGPAVTTLCAAGDNLMLHAAIEVARAGDVLVVATSAPSSHGMIGELLATLCRARGIAAVVLDAGVRDSAQIKALGLPVWSRWVSAAGTSKNELGWVNIPIACGGTVVGPGDLVIGDDDGVTVVPRLEAAVVLSRARERAAKETASLARYRRGELSLDVNELRGVLKTLDPDT